MQLNRELFSDDTFADPSERWDVSNDNGPESNGRFETKRDKELLDTIENSETEPLEGDVLLKEKTEPTPEEIRALIIGKHQGTEEEWKMSTGYAEWNTQYLREDGVIVNHEGEVIVGKVEETFGEDSVQAQRDKEVLIHLKSTINDPIQTRDWERLDESGNKVLRVSYAFRRENNEIQHVHHDFIIEKAEVKDSEEEPELDQNQEESLSEGLDSTTSFATIEADGSVIIDLNLVLQTEQEESLEEGDEDVVVVEAIINGIPMEIPASEQKVFVEEITPQILAFTPKEISMPVQESGKIESLAQVSEVTPQEVVSAVFAEVVPELMRAEPEVVAVILEDIVLSVSNIIKTETNTGIPAEIISPVFTPEPVSLIQREVIAVASEFVKQEEVRIENTAVVEVYESTQEQVQKQVPEIVSREASVPVIDSVEVIQPLQVEARNESLMQEQNTTEQEVIFSQKDEVIKIIQESEVAQEKPKIISQEEVAAIVREQVIPIEHEIPKIAEAVAIAQEAVTVLSERPVEQSIEFVPLLSVEASNNRSKESPFVVYENELQLRESTESIFSTQESAQLPTGIPDSSMSPANAAVAANDNLEETREHLPAVVVEEVTQNGITLNLRDAA